MPYLIEIYSKSLDGKLILRNIDQFNVYETKAETIPAIQAMYAEQVSDNNVLMQDYYSRLESQLLDQDTEDRILREPKPYAYIFKAAKYSKAAIKKIP